MKRANSERPLQWHTSSIHIKIRQNQSSDSGVETYRRLDRHDHPYIIGSCALCKKHIIRNFITSLQFIVRSLHDAHEMNAHRAFRVCLCVYFNSRNAGTDFHEIWYGYYAKLVPFPATSNSNKTEARTFEVGATDT
jgi:hypothetical protein